MAQEPDNSQRLAAPPNRTAPSAVLKWWLCAVLVALVVVAVILPTSALSWLRRDYEIIGLPLLWLDDASASLPLDLTHVALFGLVGFAMAVLWPRARWWQIALPLLILAVGSELLQSWVPGREPKISDVIDDLVGAAIGCALALPIRWWARRF